jgi:two-component system, OmpR family, sensor kinase
MSLAARVSGFFLATLALVLVGVSVTLYLLTSAHLHRDLDERLGLALDSLATSAEVDPGRVEWNPGGRAVSVVHPDNEPVLWLVSDDRGVTVDRTWEIAPVDLAAVAKLAPRTGHTHETFADLKSRRWRMALRRIHAGAMEHGTEASRTGAEADEPQSLVLSTVESLAPTESALRNAALVLAGLSIGFWLLAAVVGWWLCKRALLPVTRMAKAAGSMSMADRDHRLPIPGTGDELDLLAGSFNGLLDRLHQEFERQKRFTGDASHQLRTPLAALLGQLEVAGRRERTVEEYRRVLDEAHCEAVRLRQIVESLLFMARAESEAGSPELEPIELSLWIRERLAHRLEGTRADDIRERLTTEPPAWVHGQPQLLGQLLGNLLDNACKYSAPGTPITVEVGREGGCVTLAVQDEGVGLNAEDLPHVFEPFYRSSKARRRPGVGLGLAVAERIAHVFGGSMRVESSPGRGSRFILRLPDATRSVVTVNPQL